MDEKLFNIVKRGYDQDEVDNHLKELYAVIGSYKEKDNAIKNAIINAQISADNIIKNAEIEGDRIKRRAVKLLDEIQESIDVNKRITHEFQDEYNRLVSKYLQSIGDSEIKQIFDKIAELEAYVNSIQKIHDANPEINREAGLQYSTAASQMVVGTQTASVQPEPIIQQMRALEIEQSPSIDDASNDSTVAVVAELLARDSNKNRY